MSDSLHAFAAGNHDHRNRACQCGPVGWVGCVEGRDPVPRPVSKICETQHTHSRDPRAPWPCSCVRPSARAERGRAKTLLKRRGQRNYIKKEASRGFILSPRTYTHTPFNYTFATTTKHERCVCVRDKILYRIIEVRGFSRERAQWPFPYIPTTFSYIKHAKTKG